MRKIVAKTYRLFSYGCSFSSWYNPTPLDWLSSCFTNYYSFGRPGGCNSIVSDRVNKDYHDMDVNDLMIIQWTGLLRHTPKSQTDIDDYAEEFTCPWVLGDIEHPYDLVLQYHNNTRNLFSTLKLNKTNYITTHMMSPWLSDTLGEPMGHFYGIENDSTRMPFKKKYDKHFKTIVETGLLNNIETLFKSNPYSVESMMDFYLRKEIDMEKPILMYHPDSQTFKEDHHPAPIDTLLYAREILAPKVKSIFGIDLSYLFSSELDEYAKTWMHLVQNEKEIIKDRVMWMEEGNSIHHTNFKPYIPWRIDKGKLKEYKLPIN